MGEDHTRVCVCVCCLETTAPGCWSSFLVDFYSFCFKVAAVHPGFNIICPGSFAGDDFANVVVSLAKFGGGSVALQERFVAGGGIIDRNAATVSVALRRLLWVSARPFQPPSTEPDDEAGHVVAAGAVAHRVGGQTFVEQLKQIERRDGRSRFLPSSGSREAQLKHKQTSKQVSPAKLSEKF